MLTLTSLARADHHMYHARVTRSKETDVKQRVSEVDLANSNSTIQPGSEHCSAGESLADKQLKDPDIGPLLAWRLRQVNPPPISELVAESAATKELWSQWHSLVLKNGVLYRRHEYKNGQPVAMQLIVPSSMKNDFIKQVHGGMCGGHMGIRRTIEQVQKRGYWRYWRRDVDVVYGMPEKVVSVNYDDYAEEMEDRMRTAYTFVRQNLQRAAERSKRYHDLRVRPQTHEVEDWFYYYNPRKFAEKQKKMAASV